MANMDIDKTKLLEAIQKERDRFSESGHNTKDHDLALDYLKNGYIDLEDSQIAKYDVLDACVNDIEGIYYDYVINP